MEIQQLFKQYYARMYRMARTFLYDEQECEDVISDIFEALLQRQVSLLPGTEESYLMKSVRNRCLKRIRYDAIRNVLPEASLHNLPLQEEADDDFSEVVDGIVMRLPELDRRIFRMYFHEGHTFDVIAREVGISRVSVWKLYPDAPISISYERWGIGVDVRSKYESLDYQRGSIDTLITDTWTMFYPTMSFRHVTSDGKRDFTIGAKFRYDHEPLLNRINFCDDSQPFVIRLTNPDLKGRATTDINIKYKDQSGRKQQLWNLSAMLYYHHRRIAQSVSYNPQSGVYTYKPMNVNGAYYATTKFEFSRNIDEQRYWRWQINAEGTFDHSVDHAMLAGETESHQNVVNTLTLCSGAYIQYNKKALNIRATGDLRWRRSAGRMYDFETLNAFEFNYGVTARYTLPRINTTIAADGAMYSRRGYGSDALNTDDFVLNASVSQPFLKGKLIAKVEAFDLFHQLSSTRYVVNAQGRTETWNRTLPNYVMLHLVYHWNKNPKK